MLAVAWRHVRRHPRRFVASAGAIAGSVTLVVVAAGIYAGVLASIAEYLGSLPGDAIVAEAGSAVQIAHSSSAISPAVEAAVRAVPGVAHVDPLYGHLAWLEQNGRQAIVFLVGLGPHARFGRPVRVIAGKKKPKLGEVIVDRTLAHDLGVGLGDRLHLGNGALTIVGIATGGNALLASYAFTHIGAFALAGHTRPSYLFVRGAPGVAAAALTTTLRSLPEARVFTRGEFRTQNEGLARQLLLPLISLVVLLSAAITGGIVALTLYTATWERRADWGLMAALGVPARAIERVVLTQGALVGLGGVGLGCLCSWGLMHLIPALEPRFAVTPPAWVVAVASLGAVAIGIAAAWGPTRAASRIDPAEAFRV